MSNIFNPKEKVFGHLGAIEKFFLKKILIQLQSKLTCLMPPMILTPSASQIICTSINIKTANYLIE
jgi:hypothetical protein